MIEIQLEYELAKFVAHYTRTIQLEEEHADPSVADLARLTVYQGHLPPKQAALTRDVFPFAIVVLNDGDGDLQNPDTMTASVDIKIGVFEETSTGYHQAVLVMNALRAAIVEQRILGDVFTLARFPSWHRIEDSPYPYWSVVMKTTWNVPAPQFRSDAL